MPSRRALRRGRARRGSRCVPTLRQAGSGSWRAASVHRFADFPHLERGDAGAQRRGRDVVEGDFRFDVKHPLAGFVDDAKGDCRGVVARCRVGNGGGLDLQPVLPRLLENRQRVACEPGIGREQQIDGVGFGNEFRIAAVRLDPPAHHLAVARLRFGEDQFGGKFRRRVLPCLDQRGLRGGDRVERRPQSSGPGTVARGGLRLERGHPDFGRPNRRRVNRRCPRRDRCQCQFVGEGRAIGGIGLGRPESG